MPIGAGRRTEREASTSSSESESSDGGIDDDSLLERMAAAARRGARRVALRNAIGHRATRRVERHGGLPLATIQQRWDLAMTIPKASADGVRAYDDDSTRTGATRGGDVAQGEGGRIELPVAEEVGHARSKVSGHSASGAGRVRFGEDNAEGRGDGGWRSTSPSPAGAKQAKAAHGGARPNAGEGGGVELSVAEEVGHARSKVSGHSASGAERVRFGEDADAARADCPPDSERGGLRFDARQHNVECRLSAQRAFEQTTRDRVAARRCGESARECLELAAKLRASHTDVERKTGNGGDSRGGGSDVFVRPERVRGNHSFGHLWPEVNMDSVQSAEPSTQQNLHRSQSGGGSGSESDERRSPQAPRRRRTGVRGRQQDEHVRLAFNGTTPSPEAVFAYRAARRAERFEAETAERGSSGSQLPTARQPTSRVHRVADFAKWADQVAEAAKADAAAASTTFDWREERRRRKSAAHTAPTGEAEDDLKRVSVDRSRPRSAAKTREEPGTAASAPRKAAGLITQRPNASRHDSGPGMQVGARERRTAPAGHGFRVSATVDDVAGESEQNDDEHQQRLLEAAAPRARRSPELSDDETRKRRRSPTQDNGRRSFGSRQLERLQSAMSAFRSDPPETETESASRRRPGSHDDDSWETGSSFDDRGKRRSHGSTTKARAALRTSRQRQRWVHQLDALGVLPQGEGRIDSIRALGAQRQRADAYAAAAARAAPGGAGRPTPVALGSSVQEGLEATAASALSLDELVKLPSYSMARVTSESDDFVRLAPFPVTNVSPAADPMPEVSDAASGVTNPDWRPKAITDVYTHEGVSKIMAWFEEMRVYEIKGVAKKGSGLRRPDDLILDDEYVQPEARGRAWYLLDHVRSGGAEPIVPLEEAAPLAPVIQADRQCRKRHATSRHRAGAMPRVRGRATARVPSLPGGLCTGPTPVAARPPGREILCASVFLNTRCF